MTKTFFLKNDLFFFSNFTQFFQSEKKRSFATLAIRHSDKKALVEKKMLKKQGEPKNCISR